MKFAAVIPARYGSTRFPGKALALLNGKPIVQHVWERSSLCTMLNDVVVATDDQRIASAVKDFGGKVMMTSKSHLSGTDRCAEVLSKWKGQKPDVLINVQGDEPLIEPDAISELCLAFTQTTESPHSHPQIATLAILIKDPDELDNPNCVKVVCDLTSNALYFSRTPIPWSANKTLSGHLQHIGLYAFRSTVLSKLTKLPVGRLEQLEKLEQLRWLEAGYPIRVIKTVHHSHGIDTPADLEAVRLRLRAGR